MIFSLFWTTCMAILNKIGTRVLEHEPKIWVSFCWTPRTFNVIIHCIVHLFDLNHSNGRVWLCAAHSAFERLESMMALFIHLSATAAMAAARSVRRTMVTNHLISSMPLLLATLPHQTGYIQWKSMVPTSIFKQHTEVNKYVRAVMD